MAKAKDKSSRRVKAQKRERTKRIAAVLYSSKSAQPIEITGYDTASFHTGGVLRQIDVLISDKPVTTRDGISIKPGVFKNTSDDKVQLLASQAHVERDELVVARLNLLSLIQERSKDLETESAWGEALISLFDAGMQRLDSPTNHIAYIREKIEEASRRGIG